MKKNKKRKILLYVLASMLIMNTNIELCLAAGDTGTGGNGGRENQSGNQELPWSEYTKEKKLFRYRYNSGIGLSTSTKYNLYNIEGQSLIPIDITIDEKNALKAGTWVGVNVTETETASWNVTNFEAHEIKKVYTCTYTKPGHSYPCGTDTGACGVTSCSPGWNFNPFIPGSIFGCCKKTKYCTSGPQSTSIASPQMDYNESYNCPEPDPGWSLDGEPTFKEVQTSAGETENYLRQHAYNTAAANARASVKSATLKVQYIKKNSYLENIEPGILTGKAKYDTPIGTGVGGPSGSYRQEYEFFPNNVCMNLKTSKVEYRQEECKTSEGEIKIKNKTVRDNYLGKDVTFWHYFIPLDAKKNSKFNLNIITTGETMSYEQCKNLMEEDKGSDPKIYTKRIVPYNDQTSNKAYSFDATKNHQYNLDILRKAGKCQWAIEIDIPIKQEFYNEVEEKNGNYTFKGFNFYYKPININDPFPNGLTGNSLWSDWYSDYKSGKKVTPDLTKSYSEWTYITQNINASEVRKYNKFNNYTSWSNITLDGKSKYIDNEGIIKRNPEMNNNIYKLGCGVKNSNPNNKILYIEGCEKKS